MSIHSTAAAFILGAAATIAAGATFLQDHNGTGAPPSKSVKTGDEAASKKAQQDEMMKAMQAWKDSITPGEQHTQMLRSVGEYDMVARFWLAGPDAPPTECKGTSEVKSICNGHYIQQTDHNSYPMPDMQTGAIKMTPMEGVGIFGYDNYQRMYVGCWVDSLNTYMLSMRGVMAPGSKTLTMYGEMDEPMLGVRGRTVKYVTNHISDDQYTFTIYDLAAGDNYKAVEVEYTRKK